MAASPSVVPPSLSSPPTLPLDLTSPPRIVQKQVLQARGHADGCSVVLFLRLALPGSSKTRSFPLFPDDGVKLKSSAVYPVTLAKGGRTVIPPDASNGLKRASRILAFGGQEDERNGRMPSIVDDRAGETESASLKQVKPRITSSNFHITVVCPPSKEGPSEGQTKSHFVAVIQIEVGLSLKPPNWPFEVRIPIPRCLNNKLHFVTDNDSSDDGYTVEFDPRLVNRPSSRSRTSEINALESHTDFEGEQDANEDDSAISGPFPASDMMVARWAHVNAGAEKLRGTATTSGHHPIHGSKLFSEAQILSVQTLQDHDVQVSLRFQISLAGFYYPGLDPTASLNLAFAAPSDAQWVPDLLSVQSERSRTLYAWSADGREVTTMSRTSSLNQIFTQQQTLMASNSSTGALEADGMLDDESNIVDVQPPKGVFDVSIDGSIDSSNSLATLAPPSNLTLKKNGRQNSTGSVQSLASEYSQRSATEGTSIHLLLRTASLREASREGNDLSFFVEGSIRTRAIRKDEDGTLSLACPALIASHVPSHATLCSVTNDVALRNASGQTEDCPTIFMGGSLVPSGLEVIKFPEHSEHASPDTTADSAKTIGYLARKPNTQDALHVDVGHDSEESISMLSLPSILPSSGSDGYPGLRVEQWAGVAEEATVTVWVRDLNVEGLQERRTRQRGTKVVHRLQMSWPTMWPSAEERKSALGTLLPLVVFALPRADDDQLIKVLHASVQGRPVDIASNIRDEEAVRPEEARASRIVDLRLPDALQNAQGPVMLALTYSVEGGSGKAPLCLFPSMASSVTHIRAKIHDDEIRGALPIVRYTQEPISSAVRSDERQGRATVEISMLPAMTTVMVDFAPRTQPLTPLSPSPTAPIRRQSTITAKEGILEPPNAAEQDLPQARISERSRGRSTPWSMAHVLLTFMLAMMLYNVSTSVGHNLLTISHKVDLVALALNIDSRDGTWTPEQAYVDQRGTNSKESMLDWLHNVEQNVEHATGKAAWTPERSAVVDRPSESEAGERSLSVPSSTLAEIFSRFSLGLWSVTSWPFRVVGRLFSLSA